MSKSTVKFSVTASAGISGYWIAVGNEDVELDSGKGSIDLPTSADHRLVWWMAGKHKEHISITGKSGSETIVKVSKSKVTDDGEGAGNKRFST